MTRAAPAGAAGRQTARGGARARRLARDVLVRRLGLLPAGGNARLYALPGLGSAAALRWRLLLGRRPVLDLDAYGARVPVGEIEELLACPLCGGREVQPLLAPARPGRWSYRVVRCPACGMLYRNPGIRPERLGDLYSGGKYAKFLTGRYGRARQAEYRRVMDAYAPLLADGRGRRLLDYGAGAGLFLEVAAERGFDGYGVDLSPDAVQAARRRPGGANVFLGAPGDVPEIAAGGFDVICLWSVLAHLPRPLEDMRSLRALLADDGVLVISTVNANSLTLKATGERWGGFTPNHLVFFSPRTIRELLRRAGFAAVVERPMYGEAAERHALRPGQERRLRRTVERGNQGRMLRVAAFADPGGPARWGLQAGAVALATAP